MPNPNVDERSIQPWDRSRGSTCWRVNTFIPTLAVGLPITTTSTLQQIFLGLVWQPMPAIGLVGGAHLGSGGPDALGVL